MFMAFSNFSNGVRPQLISPWCDHGSLYQGSYIPSAEVGHLGDLSQETLYGVPRALTQRRALVERESFTFHEAPYPFRLPLLFVDCPV